LDAMDFIVLVSIVLGWVALSAFTFGFLKNGEGDHDISLVLSTALPFLYWPIHFVLMALIMISCLGQKARKWRGYQ